MTHKLPDDSFHFFLKNKRGYPQTPEVGISVGKKISCSKCGSKKISVFFKPGFPGYLIQEWSDFLEKNDFKLYWFLDYVFDKDDSGNIVRKCQLCSSGTLSLKNSFRGGAFIGCSNYPECKFTRPLSKAKAAAPAKEEAKEAPKAEAKPKKEDKKEDKGDVEKQEE